MQHPQEKIDKIINLYDTCLVSFRNIGELQEINLPMKVVRRIYHKNTGTIIDRYITKYQKPINTETEYQEARKREQEEEASIRKNERYWEE